MLRSDQKSEIAHTQIYPSHSLFYATMQTVVLRDGILLSDECEAFLPKLDGEVFEIVGKVCDNKQQHTFDVPCASRTASRHAQRIWKESGKITDCSFTSS